MKQLTTTLLLGTFLLGAGLPVFAQGYHQNYGGGRVTKQNQIGLYHNDASYVSSGTLGQSARDGGVHKAGMAGGGVTGSQAGGGLPTTSWGGYIRNPGDGLYDGINGEAHMDNQEGHTGQIVYADDVNRANQYKRAMAQRRYQQQMMQMQMQNRQAGYGNGQGNYYQPGSNGSAANYGSGVAGYGSYNK